MTPEQENTQENPVSPLVGGEGDAPETTQPETTDAAPEVENTEVETPEVPTPEETEPVVPDAPAAPVPPAQPTAHAPQVEAPVEDDKVRYDKRAHRMKKVLDEQPKVKFAIPLAQGERKGAYETVQINGYKLTIMKGEMVDLPQQVVELLAEKYKIGLEAGQEFRVDADQNRADALG